MKSFTRLRLERLRKGNYREKTLLKRGQIRFENLLHRFINIKQWTIEAITVHFVYLLINTVY